MKTGAGGSCEASGAVGVGFTSTGTLVVTGGNFSGDVGGTDVAQPASDPSNMTSVDVQAKLSDAKVNRV